MTSGKSRMESSNAKETEEGENGSRGPCSQTVAGQWSMVNGRWSEVAPTIQRSNDSTIKRSNHPNEC